MPSRRISSYTQLAPIQEIAINPFDSFNSDTVNKLTRVLSNNTDCVVHGLDVKNSNEIVDNIKNFELFRSGQNFIPENWECRWSYDPDDPPYQIISGTYLDGFKIQDITEVCVRTIRFKIDTNKFKNLFGKNVFLKFNVKFNMVSGSPSSICVRVKDDVTEIKYPRYKSEQLEFFVTHNLQHDKENEQLFLDVQFVLNPSDVYCGTGTEKSIRQTYYNGQSDIYINKINYNCDLLGDVKYSKYDYSPILNNDVYSNSQIHPTDKIYVTPGFAIKDDTIIQEYGINKNPQKPCIVLNLNDRKTWIKDNPFTIADFKKPNNTQKAYVFNRTENQIVLNGGVVDSTGKLCFGYGDITNIGLLDNGQISQYDYNLNFKFTRNDSGYNLEIFEQSITSGHIDLYGKNGYIVSESNKIIKCIDLDYDITSHTYKYQKIYISDSDLKGIDISKISVVSSIGPIKVSCKNGEFNSNIVQWANVVIYYSYYKHPEPNVSYIGLIRDEDLNNLNYREDYLVLARVRFVSPNTIDLISYENRQQLRFPFTCYGRSSQINYGDELSEDMKTLWLKHYDTLPTTIFDAVTRLFNTFQAGKMQSDWEENDKSKLSYIWNKPSIPGPQKQSDWNQENESELDYIKNKPIIDKTELVPQDNHIPSSKLIKEVHKGNPGQVFYSNGDYKIEARTILNDQYYICLEDDDVQKCKDNGSKEYPIIDAKNNRVWIYDINLNRWVDRTSELPVAQYINPGTQYYNSIIKKLYWSDENRIVKELKLNGDGSGRIQSDWAESDPDQPSYIKNKPTQPISQIQSDWNQKDSTRVDYIKNKPDALDIYTILNKIYPIGYIFITIDPRNPHEIFNFGTWEKIAINRCLWGCWDDQKLGTTIDSKLPNIKGKFETNPNEEYEHFADNSTASGAIIMTRDKTWNLTVCEDIRRECTGFTKLDFDAHNYNDIYDDTQQIVQPPAFYVNIWKRVVDPVVTYLVRWFDYDNTLLKSENVISGNSANPPQVPSHEGLIFVNWDREYTNITSDTDIYAVYNIRQITVTFRHNVSGISDIVTVYNYGSQFGTLPSTTRVGYYLDGWYNGTTKISSTSIVKSETNTLDVDAHWTVKNILMMFNYDGGVSGEASRILPFGSKYGTLPVTSKTGYTFNGWYNGSTKVNENTIVNQETTIYLKAYWNAKNVQINFDYNGGSGTEASRTVQYGSQYGQLPTATKTGYTFDGWYNGNVKVSASTIVNQETTITLKAVWIAQDVLITFNYNGGTTGITSKTVKYDSTYGDLPTTTRQNYKFDGWYNETTKVNSSTAVKQTGTISLKANWNPEYVTITFNKNY